MSPCPPLRWATTLLCVAGPAAAQAIDPAVDAATDPSPGAAEVVDVVDLRPAERMPSATERQLGDAWAYSATLDQVMATVPGTALVQLGGLGDFSAVSIRGAGQAETLVRLDGIALNPDGAGVVDLSTWPVQLLQAVTVWRSRAPLALGSPSAASVIDLSTTGPGAAASSSPTVQAQLTAGSWGTGRAGVQAMVPTPGAVDWLMAADLLHTAGNFTVYDDAATPFTLSDDRLRDRSNNRTTQLSSLGRLRANLPGGQLTGLLTVLDRDEGVPGPLGAPALSTRLRTRRHLLALSSQHTVARTTFNPTLSWLHRAERYDDRAGEVGVGVQWNDTRLDQLNAALHLALAPPRCGACRVIAGLDGVMAVRQDWAQQQDRLAVQADLARRRTSARAGLSGTLALGRHVRLRADAGALLLRDSGATDTASTAAARTQAWPTGLGELTLQPTDWLAVVGGAQATVRPPRLDELFGDRGAVVANPDLRAEQRWGADLGLRLQPPLLGFLGLDLSVVGLLGGATDRIVYVQNTQRSSVPINLGRTASRGVEGALGLTIGPPDHPWIRHDSSLTWLDARDRTQPATFGFGEAPVLPRQPPWTWSAQTRFTLPKRTPLTFGHGLLVASPSWWDAANLTRSGPRALHDLHLRVQPWFGPAAVRAFGLELAVRNLADTVALPTAQNPGSPLAGADNARLAALSDLSAYPLPGRTLLLTLSWSPQ